MKKIKRKGVHCTFLGFLHCTTLLAVTSITLFGFLSSLAFNNRIEKFNTNNKISGGPYFQGGPGPEAVPLLPPSRAGPECTHQADQGENGNLQYRVDKIQILLVYLY